MKRILTIAAAVAGVLVLASPLYAQDDAAMAQYEAILLGDPTFGVQLTEMSKGYPVEWREMIRESYRRYVQGEPPATVDAYRRDYIQRFHVMIRPDMLKAPSGAIAEYARANAEFMGLLMRENVEVCAAIVTARPPPAGAPPMAPATLKALTKAQTAMIRAAKVGAANPVTHGGPNQADNALVSGTFRDAGGQLADIAKVGDPRSDLTARQRCDAAGRWSQAVAKAPNAIIARQMNR